MILSSTEVEYVAVSDVCTQIIFIKMMMEFLQLEIVEHNKLFTTTKGNFWLDRGKIKAVKSKCRYWKCA